MTDPRATTVLDQIDRTDRLFKFTLCGAVLLEGLVIAAMLVAVDFHRKDELLVLLLGLGLINLTGVGFILMGVQIKRGTLRILRALELTRD